MSTEEEVETATDELCESVSEVADDTGRWTQEQSAEIYEGVASSCRERAALIRREMDES